MLIIKWDRNRLGVHGRTVARQLFDTDPRIATPGGRGASNAAETGISITPYQMSAGEEKVVADRLFELLSHPPKQEAVQPPQPPAADLSGRWDVRIEYAAGSSNHMLHLRQQANRIEGTHQGDFVSRDLTGTIDGDAVQMTSSYTERHGDSLMFNFSGKVAGSEISGTLDMGEYLTAKWNARRHEYRKE